MTVGALVLTAAALALATLPFAVFAYRAAWRSRPPCVLCRDRLPRRQRIDVPTLEGGVLVIRAVCHNCWARRHQIGRRRG